MLMKSYRYSLQQKINTEIVANLSYTPATVGAESGGNSVCDSIDERESAKWNRSVFCGCNYCVQVCFSSADSTNNTVLCGMISNVFQCR